MKKITATVASSLFCCTIALSCSCIGERTVQKEFSFSDVVFIGRAISVEIVEIRDTSFLDEITIKLEKYSFAISTHYKGCSQIDTITIFTGIGHGDCGLEFTLGNEYIVYSYYKNRLYPKGKKRKKILYTNVCTRSRLALDSKEVSQLEKIRRRRFYLFRR